MEDHSIDNGIHDKLINTVSYKESINSLQKNTVMAEKAEKSYSSTGAVTNNENQTQVEFLPNTGENTNNTAAYAMLLAALGMPLVLSNRRRKDQNSK